MVTNRETHLAFRATKTESRLIRLAAAKAGLKLAEFLRTSALARSDQVLAIEAGLREGARAARAGPSQPAAKGD